MVSFAQDDCTTPLVATDGLNTAPAITGIYEGGCYGFTATDAGGTINGLWYTYIPASDGELTISSNLDANVAPNSFDTIIEVMKGDCGTLVCVAKNDDVSDTIYLSQVTFPVAAGVTYYIQWSNYRNADGFEFKLDFTPVSCLKVYNIFGNTNFTTTSVTLNWDPSISNPANYELEYGPVGFTQGSGTTINPTTATATITGLNPSTNYDYYLRSNCGTTQSVWTTVNKFTTAKVLPYTSNFDTETSLIGWTIETNGPGGLENIVTGTAGQASTPGYWSFSSSTTVTVANNNWLYSPAVSLQSGEQVTVSFYTRSGTFPRTIRVTVGSDNDSAMQTTQLAALNITAGIVWNLNTIPVFTAPAAGIYYFGFNDNSAATATSVNMRLDTFSFTSVLGNVVAPSALSYNSPNVFTRNLAIANLNPTISGGAVTSYSISPALPTGLSFNTSTGVISGTPTAISAITTYTVTATNTGGSTSFDVVITVNDAAPSDLSYNSPNVFTVGSTISDLIPTVLGVVLSYSISPSLPDGLVFDTARGIISGTPTTISPTASYTVTATNPTGSVSFDVSITVQELLNSDENQFKDISIYPNPFLDIINVNGSLLYSSFTIYSVDGKLIQEDAIIGSVINVKQVPSGIYFLKLSDKENLDKIFKVIKR